MCYNSRHCTIYGAGNVVSCVSARGSIFKKYIYYQKILIFCNDTRTSVSLQANLPIWLGHAKLNEIVEMHKDQELDLKYYPWSFLEEKIENKIWNCIIAKYNDMIIGYSFYSNSEMIFAGSKTIEFKLPKYFYYGFREFVRPKYRGKNIHKALNSYRSFLASESGCYKLFVAINSNEISIHNHEKLGGYKVGSVTFIKNKFFNKAFVSPGSNSYYGIFNGISKGCEF